MMRLLIITTLLSISYITYGQGGYVKFIDSGLVERNQVRDILYDEHNNQLVTIYEYIDSSNIYSLGITAYDTTGAELWSTIQPGSNDYDYLLVDRNNILQLNDSTYSIYGNHFRDDMRYRVLISSDGSVLDDFKYENLSDSRGLITRNQLLLDSNIYISHHIQKLDYSSSQGLQKFDSEGTLNSEIRYESENEENAGAARISTDGNHIIAGGSEGSGSPSFPTDIWSSKNYILLLDKELNLISKIESQTDTNDGIISEIVPFYNDDNEARLAFCSSIFTFDESFFGIVGQIRYLIIDLEGNIQHSIIIGNDFSSSNSLPYNKRVENGFITAGQMVTANEDALLPMVVKFNEEADTVWSQLYDINDRESYFDRVITTGMQVLPSGSIVLCGNLSEIDELQQSTLRPFIMKLDKDGCLEPGCRMTTSTDDLNIDRELLLTPNPTTGHVQLSANQDGTLTLYSATGNKLMTVRISQGTNDIDISHLGSGIIIYNLKMDDVMQTGKVIKIK